MPTKYKYAIGIVAIAAIAVAIYIYWPKAPQQSQSSTIPVPEIFAPAEWRAEPQTLGFTIFVKQGDGGGQIDVGALKTGKTLEQWLATLYNGGNFPYATLTATSSVDGAEAITWALVDGHLILVDSDLESASNRALNYSVFDQGNVYIFSLMTYQLYNSSTKAFEINQAGVQTVQTMVQNFAESLPSSTSE